MKSEWKKCRQQRWSNDTRHLECCYKIYVMFQLPTKYIKFMEMQRVKVIHTHSYAFSFFHKTFLARAVVSIPYYSSLCVFLYLSIFAWYFLSLFSPLVSRCGFSFAYGNGLTNRIECRWNIFPLRKWTKNERHEVKKKKDKKILTRYMTHICSRKQTHFRKVIVLNHLKEAREKNVYEKRRQFTKITENENRSHGIFKTKTILCLNETEWNGSKNRSGFFLFFFLSFFLSFVLVRSSARNDFHIVKLQSCLRKWSVDILCWRIPFDYSVSENECFADAFIELMW